MKNLISMVDFVLYRHLKRKSCINDTYDYARFLKQPLQLWMFVPCDEDGNFLDEFVHIVEGGFSREYQQAKERCLFEGCVYDEEMNAVRKDIGIMIYSVKYESKDTIEDLIKYNLQLTPTAQKQFQP